jgi:hypothetical protein
MNDSTDTFTTARAIAERGAPYELAEVAVMRKAALAGAGSSVETALQSIYGREWRARIQAADREFVPRTLDELQQHAAIAHDDWQHLAATVEHLADDYPSDWREEIVARRDAAQGRYRDYCGAMRKLL